MTRDLLPLHPPLSSPRLQAAPPARVAQTRARPAPQRSGDKRGDCPPCQCHHRYNHYHQPGPPHARMMWRARLKGRKPRRALIQAEAAPAFPRAAAPPREARAVVYVLIQLFLLIPLLQELPPLLLAPLLPPPHPPPQPPLRSCSSPPPLRLFPPLPRPWARSALTPTS